MPTIEGLPHNAVDGAGHYFNAEPSEPMFEPNVEFRPAAKRSKIRILRYIAGKGEVLQETPLKEIVRTDCCGRNVHKDEVLLHKARMGH